MTDYVPRQDYDDLQLESHSLKEQLVQCLEELAAREREAVELAQTSNRCSFDCGPSFLQLSAAPAIVGSLQPSVCTGDQVNCTIFRTCPVQVPGQGADLQ